MNTIFDHLVVAYFFGATLYIGCTNLTFLLQLLGKLCPLIPCLDFAFGPTGELPSSKSPNPQVAGNVIAENERKCGANVDGKLAVVRVRTERRTTS